MARIPALNICHHDKTSPGNDDGPAKMAPDTGGWRFCTRPRYAAALHALNRAKAGVKRAGLRESPSINGRALSAIAIRSRSQEPNFRRSVGARSAAKCFNSCGPSARDQKGAARGRRGSAKSLGASPLSCYANEGQPRGLGGLPRATR